MTAQQLATLLRAQAAAAPHQVRLDDATLGTNGLDAVVRSDLRRPSGTLVLQVDPGAIPATPNNPFSFPATVPAGADGFLNLGGRDATVSFQVGATVALQVTVQTTRSAGAPVGWVFSDSFPELFGQPFDRLHLTAPQLTVSTSDLAFTGTLALEGLFAAAASLV